MSETGTKTYTILVVDDNPMTRKMVRVALSAEEYDVLEAGNGADALKMIETEVADLILLDLVLPDYEGTDLMEKISAIKNVKDVPVIAFSASLSKLDLARVKKVGFRSFISKPVEPSTLIGVIKAHLPLNRPRIKKRGRPMKILVVDDDPVQLKLCRIYLEKLGYATVAAENGLEGLEHAKSLSPDAIVSDILMSVMDGFEFCFALRNVKDLAHIPVILFSNNYTDDEDRKLAFEAGAAGYVTPKTDFQALTKAIEDCFKASYEPRKIYAEEDFKKKHSLALFRQLERLISLNNKLATRCEILSSEVSLLHIISITTLDVEDVSGKLKEVLDYGVDACGLTDGALYMKMEEGKFALMHRVGFAENDAASLDVIFEFLKRRLEQLQLDHAVVVKFEELSGAAEKSSFVGFGIDSALMVPVLSRGGHVGFLLVACRAEGRICADLIDFSKTVAVQIGQAITISDAFKQVKKAEVRLLQAQKMEAIGRLAGGVAHDFNNLLNVIIGYSEMAALKIDRANDANRDISEVLNAAHRAAELTHQLLAFSRKQVMQAKVLNLNEIVSNMEKMLRRLIGEDIKVSTLLADGIGSVLVDRGQMEQVIMNLVVNARDAMPHGGKLIIETSELELSEQHISDRIVVPAGDYVMLAITDTGCGMTKDVLRHVFEPFYTTKPSGKGTGLGLSTVYGIVQQSGGYISVYSEKGAGTTFKIYLPCARKATSQNSRTGDSPVIGGGSETILLVEDEDSVRKLVLNALEMNGYKVLVASNGNEAIAAASNHKGKIDLLLTDVIMPEMSGSELAERMRKIRPETKVLYMSGYTDTAAVELDLLESQANYLQKPFTIQGLCSKLREILGR